MKTEQLTESEMTVALSAIATLRKELSTMNGLQHVRTAASLAMLSATQKRLEQILKVNLDDFEKTQGH